MERLLDIKEVADILGVDPKSVRRLIDRGELRFKKIGNLLRFKREWVEALIEQE